jgi:hypothetical protein
LNENYGVNFTLDIFPEWIFLNGLYIQNNKTFIYKYFSVDSFFVNCTFILHGKQSINCFIYFIFSRYSGKLSIPVAVDVAKVLEQSKFDASFAI